MSFTKTMGVAFYLSISNIPKVHPIYFSLYILLRHSRSTSVTAMFLNLQLKLNYSRLRYPNRIFLEKGKDISIEGIDYDNDESYCFDKNES